MKYTEAIKSKAHEIPGNADAVCGEESRILLENDHIFIDGKEQRTDVRALNLFIFIFKVIIV